MTATARAVAAAVGVATVVASASPARASDPTRSAGDPSDIGTISRFSEVLPQPFVIAGPVVCSCDFAIEINMLRGGSPTVSVGSTKDITARARIAKGTAIPGRTFDSTLRIDAIDGDEFIDSQTSGPIQLEVGKGGDGDKLTMQIDQCKSGFIWFRATFSGPSGETCGSTCDATRQISKICN